MPNGAAVPSTRGPFPTAAARHGRGLQFALPKSMHELSVAQGLVEVVAEELAREGPVRVISVRVRVGALAGVEPVALRFAYDAAVEGTLLAGSHLHLEKLPAAVFCEVCRAERDVAAITALRCPVCGASTPRVIRGKELEVVAVEVADPANDVVTATAR